MAFSGLAVSWVLKVDKTHLQTHPAQMRAGRDRHLGGLH